MATESGKAQDSSKARGQADKAAAEQRTADVAADNQAAEEQRVADSEAALRQSRIGTDQTPDRDDGAPERQAVDAAVNPFPDYDRSSLDELASQAEQRGVEINRDVEKAELIRKLRENDRAADEAPDGVEEAGSPYASYDVVGLEKLRELAEQRDVKLDDEFVRAHLVTELRAADTSGGVSVAVQK